MNNLQEMKPPKDLDWQSWVARWDRMQERYLVKRTDRFETIIRLVRETQQSVTAVLDLGCGTGSLMLSVLEAFPQAESIGIDFDPTMLWLAEARLTPFGNRAQVILADLRDISWMKIIQSPFNAIVSATALHWFSADQLENLYRRIARIIRPGGIFLNADHVSNDCPRIQQAWERQRSKMLAQKTDSESDDWGGFWKEYSQALGLDIREINRRVIGGWERGVEEGLPLEWHFDKLRESGFTSVDCFWRYDCDAIYGGIMNRRNNEHGS